MISTVQADSREDSYVYGEPDFKPLFEGLLSRCGALLEQAPGSWALTVLVATFQYLLWGFGDAAASFDRAMEIDRAQTEMYPWYFAYLLSSAQQDRTLFLVTAYAAKNITSAMCQALSGLFLYVLRKYDLARKAVDTARKLDERCWLVYIVAALVDFSQANHYQAALGLERLLLS